LTDDNFDEALIGEPHFIEFWAPWCKGCAALAPTWDTLARNLNPDADGKPIQTKVAARIAQVEEDEGVTCLRFDVTSFPTIYLAEIADFLGDRKLDSFQYTGKLEVGAMTEFLEAAGSVAAARARKEEWRAALAAESGAAAEAEEPAAENNADRKVKVLTAKNFDTFAAAAGRSEGSALLVFVHDLRPPSRIYSQKRGQAPASDLRHSALAELAAELEEQGQSADVVVGSLDCAAHAGLCLSHRLLVVASGSGSDGEAVNLGQLVRIQRQRQPAAGRKGEGGKATGGALGSSSVRFSPSKASYKAGAISLDELLLFAAGEAFVRQRQARQQRARQAQAEGQLGDDELDDL
jgi:thiol-disulfide isomerase/thioredoxin